MTYVFDRKLRILFRQYYTNYDLLCDVLEDLAKHDAGDEADGDAILRAGFQPQYCERLYQRPVDRQRFLSVLVENGPEAVLDASLGNVQRVIGEGVRVAPKR